MASTSPASSRSREVTAVSLSRCASLPHLTAAKARPIEPRRRPGCGRRRGRARPRRGARAHRARPSSSRPSGCCPTSGGARTTRRRSRPSCCSVLHHRQLRGGRLAGRRAGGRGGRHPRSRRDGRLPLLGRHGRAAGRPDPPRRLRAEAAPTGLGARPRPRPDQWTFDPLVRRNAYFNLTKLGAEVTALPRGLLRAHGRRAQPRRRVRPVRGVVAAAGRAGARPRRAVHLPEPAGAGPDAVRILARRARPATRCASGRTRRRRAAGVGARGHHGDARPRPGAGAGLAGGGARRRSAARSRRRLRRGRACCGPVGTCSSGAVTDALPALGGVRLERVELRRIRMPLVRPVPHVVRHRARARRAAGEGGDRRRRGLGGVRDRARAALQRRVHRRAPSTCSSTTSSPVCSRRRNSPRPQVATALAPVKGHRMAKAAIETARARRRAARRGRVARRVPRRGARRRSTAVSRSASRAPSTSCSSRSRATSTRGTAA